MQEETPLQAYQVKVVNYDTAGSKWVKNNITVSVHKGAEAGLLRKAISTATSIPADRLVIGQISHSQHRFDKFFDDAASLNRVEIG